MQCLPLFTGRPLLMGPCLLNSITLTAFTAGDKTQMDRSFPSCTFEHVHQQRQNGCFWDGIRHSNRVWICCCSLIKSLLIAFFYTKFALIRPDDWWVSFTHPWAVSTSLGRVVNSNTTIFCTPSFKCQLFFTFTQWRVFLLYVYIHILTKSTCTYRFMLEK